VDLNFEKVLMYIGMNSLRVSLKKYIEFRNDLITYENDAFEFLG
jgi:hypothetical protein